MMGQMGCRAPQSRGRKQSLICGLPRALVVLVIWGMGGMLLFRSQRLMTFALATLAGTPKCP